MQRLFEAVQRCKSSSAESLGAVEIESMEFASMRLRSLRHFRDIPKEIRARIEPYHARSRSNGDVLWRANLSFPCGKIVRIFWYDPYQSDNNFRVGIKRIQQWFSITAAAVDVPRAPKILNVYMFLMDIPKTFSGTTSGAAATCAHAHTHTKKNKKKKKTTTRKTKTSSSSFGPEDVNTAFTYLRCGSKSDNDEEEIYLYRREEWFKVLVHETIHAYGMDFACTSAAGETKKQESRIRELFHLNPKVKLDMVEAYTESLATQIHCMFLAKSIRHWRLLIAREQQWSLKQMISILRLHKPHFRYSGDDDGGENSLYGYSERTPVFSYYVLKAILLCAAAGAAAAAGRLYAGGLSQPPTIGETADVISRHAFSKSFMARVRAAEQLLDRGGKSHSKTKKKSNRALSSSLRMTISGN